MTLIRITTARANSFLAFLCAALLAGCAVGPDFVRPGRPSEQTYVTPSVADIGSAADEQHLSVGDPLRADWWVLLGSPDLDHLVDLALANNYSLDSARANLASAEQQVAVARGGLYPQVDSGTSVGRVQYGASFLGPEAFTFPTFSAYSFGGDLSYDTGAFGGTRRKIELERARATLKRETLNGARLDVAGHTVMMALEIAALRAQIAVLQDILATDQQTLDLVHSARAAGVASDMDVTTAQSQLDRDRTLLPPLNQQLDVAEDALSVLVGSSSQKWRPPEFTLSKMTLPRNLPLVIPSELVRARPDIRAAEAGLHAANAAVDVATTDLYPRIELTASLAEQGLTNGPAGTAWSLVGGITAPIFHGGALTAQRRAAQDDYRSAFAQYQQTVLTSFEQVADSLHALDNDAKSMQSEQQAFASADAALRLTRLGYGVGNAGIVQVLDAQRLRESAQLDMVRVEAKRLADTVGLFLATGGGVGAQAVASR
jgi:NodT family efflux transporter outer membrane factor (OMF) lipoprotein